MRFPKRNIMTNLKNINKSIKYKQYDNQFKPHGLWYSLFGSWYKHIESNKENPLKKYIHKLSIFNNKLTDLKHPDPDKILVLNNYDDVKRFTIKYRVKRVKSVKMHTKPIHKIYMDSTIINWKKVANDYGGIEFNPYFSMTRMVFHEGETNLELYTWYTSIDIESGCIWNINSILKDSQIVYIKDKKDKYIKQSTPILK